MSPSLSLSLTHALQPLSLLFRSVALAWRKAAGRMALPRIISFDASRKRHRKGPWDIFTASCLGKLQTVTHCLVFALYVLLLSFHFFLFPLASAAARLVNCQINLLDCKTAVYFMYSRPLLDVNKATNRSEPHAACRISNSVQCGVMNSVCFGRRYNVHVFNNSIGKYYELQHLSASQLSPRPNIPCYSCARSTNNPSLSGRVQMHSL